MRLYHYTCKDHGQPGIDRTGLLKPNPQLFLALPPVVWLTDLPTADDAMGLGLTSTYLKCDRTAVRYVVETEKAVWWPTVAKGLPDDVVGDLERYGCPEHWYLAFVDLEVMQ